MKVKRSIQSLVDAAKLADAMVSETTVSIMVSSVGATQWESAARLMIFSDNTTILIRPDNTRRKVRTVREMKAILGV